MDETPVKAEGRARGRAWRRLRRGVLRASAVLATLFVAVLGALHLPPVRASLLRLAEREASSALGARVTIASARWNLLAGTVELEGVELRGTGERARASIAARRVRVDASVLPLLAGKVRVEEAAVEGLAASLAVDRQGRLVLPFSLPEEPGEKGPLPDVVVGRVRVDGALHLAVDGEVAREVSARGIALASDLTLPSVDAAGTFSVAEVVVAARGKEPVGGTSLSLGWEVRKGAGRVTGKVEGEEARIALDVDAALSGLEGKPSGKATLSARGTLGPLGARLFPGLGLDGDVTATASAEVREGSVAGVRLEARASGLRAAGRSAEEVRLAADLSGGEMRAATLEASLAGGRVRAEASGTLLPQPRDVRFRARAEGIDPSLLLPPGPGGPRIAGALDATVEGTLARPALEAVTATAQLLLVPGSGRGTGPKPARGPARGPVLSPRVEAQAALSRGVVTVTGLRLADGATTAEAEGTVDLLRSAFSGRVDLEAPRIGPYLALFGWKGGGSLSVHLAGEGPFARPALSGRLRARALSFEGFRAEELSFTASLADERVEVREGRLAASGLEAGVEAEGTLPRAGAAPSAELRLLRPSYCGVPYPDVTARATFGETLRATLGSSDGRLQAAIERTGRGDVSGEATFDALELGGLAALLPAAVADVAVSGELSGRVKVRLPASGPPGGELVLSRLSVAAFGRRVEARGPVELLLRDGRVEAGEVALAADDGSHVALSGRGALDGSALDVRLVAGVPSLAAWGAFLPEGTGVAGSVSADVRVAGSLARPSASGSVKGSGLRFGDVAVATAEVDLSPREDGEAGGRLAVSGIRVGGHEVPGTVALTGRRRGERVDLEGSALDGRLTLRGEAAPAGDWPADLTLSFERLDAAALAELGKGRKGLTSSVTGRVRATGPLLSPANLAVEAELSEVRVGLDGREVRNERPVRASWAGSRLEVPSLDLEGNGLSLSVVGGLPAGGRAAGKLEVSARLDLRALLPFVHALDRAEGVLEARVDVTGSLASPSFSGKATLAGGLLDGPSFPAPVEALAASVLLRPEGAEVESLSARLGGGTVTLAGSLGLSGLSPTTLRATLRARDVDLPLGADLDVKGGADLSASGRWPDLSVSGEVRVEDATYVPSVDLMGLMKALGPEKRVVAGVPGPSGGPRVALDVAVVAPRAIHVEGSLAEAELGGTLHVQGTLDAPVVLGNVAATRGTVNLLGTSFELTRARLDFDDPVRIDPDVNVVGTATRGEDEITMRVTGRASKAQLSFSSARGLSQAEILAQLSGGGAALTDAAARMAVQGASASILGQLGTQVDLEFVPLPTTPEGEKFLFSVGKELGEGVTATYFKGESADSGDAFELRWRLSSRTRGRVRQNQDGTLSGGFRIRREFH